MAEQENKVIKEVQIAATRSGARLFRNSTGMAWQGQLNGEAETLSGKTVTLKSARRVKYGLAVGSSDLIGWTPLEITPDMIGQTVAVFTAVECKTKSYTKATEAQENFLQVIADAGGLAYIARPGKTEAVMEKVEPGA